MKRSSDTPIRVLVVEDSRAQRELLVGVLNASGEFVVVGTASNGSDAIAAAQQLRPNVIAMDIHLPILDGYEATRQIMQQCPTPIVLISSQDDAARRSIEALAVGALAVVAKPRGRVGAAVAPAQDDDHAAFLMTLRLMADVRVVTRHPARLPTSSHRSSATGQLRTVVVDRHAALVAPQVLAIAASTGGPAAVQRVLRGLGAGFPLPILVVQHIARGFVPALVEWLNTTVPLPVQVASQGERLLAGQVYLAPDDNHLTVRAPGFASLRPLAADDSYCPSADRLFETAAHAYGAGAIGLVLTGMGDDGTRGLLALRAAGAPTLAQDAESCVVYGMPRAAVEAGAIMRSEPLATIAGTILGLVGNVARDVGAS
jgi:two-component system, chemotaxis family, protein-glutamate methylesterase/glutaminase